MKTNTENSTIDQGRTAPSSAPASIQELMLSGLFEAMIHNSPAKARGVIASHCLAALLANPSFTPQRDAGEELTEAYARRAVDCADALISELERRKGKDVQ